MESWPLTLPYITRPKADAPIPFPPPHRDADHHRLHLGAASLLQVPPGEEWESSGRPFGLGGGEFRESGAPGVGTRLCLTSGGLSMSLGPDL